MQLGKATVPISVQIVLFFLPDSTLLEYESKCSSIISSGLKMEK